MGKNTITQCDALLLAALDAIRHKMAINYWNEHQEDFMGSCDDPFGNTATSWGNDVFQVRAYDWGEEGNVSPNFRWKNLSVWWYKYLGRGMDWNVEGGELTPDLINEMLNQCLESLEIREDEEEE